MSITQTSLAELLREHVTLEIESIDRMYLNVYIPRLQCESGASWFLKQQRQYPVASSAAMAPISRAFVEAIESYAKVHQVPVLTFAKGQRKDDVVAPYLKQAAGQEGIVLIGKAQEKTTTFRTTKGFGPRTPDRYPRLLRTTAMVNQYYFYGIDRDFGPFFFKFSSYFPYSAKFCLNGHEYLKHQLGQAGIGYEALDNGIRACADPSQMQRLADGLSAEKIEALVRKWQARLSQPFTAAERQAGYDYEISILQAEFALTQLLDRPVTGRLFFEAAIHENLDLGRPEQVQLIFERRITKATPSRFRTRIITEGVTPTLHIDYKHSRIKQYHKEGRALRTETTVNNTRDFRIGKRLKNLPASRLIGFQANRRLLHVQQISHNCLLGEEALPTSEGFRPAGGRLAFHRPARPGLVQRPRRLSASASGVRQSRVAGAARTPPGLCPRSIDPRPDDVPLAPAAFAWLDHTHSQHAPLPGHRLRLARSFLLHPFVCQSAPAWPGSDCPSGTALESPAASTF